MERMRRIRSWLRLAPALVLAALGWQIGVRAWRTPPAPRLDAAAWVSSSPVVSLPPLQTPDVLPPLGLEGAGPGPFRLALPPLTLSPGQPPPTGPPVPLAPPLAARPSEAFTGPLSGAGREYEGRPLPLPSPDQVRFLLRREPIAVIRPAAPLLLAPPDAVARPPTAGGRPPTAAGAAPAGGDRPVAAPSRVALGPPAPVAARPVPRSTPKVADGAGGAGGSGDQGSIAASARTPAAVGPVTAGAGSAPPATTASPNGPPGAPAPPVPPVPGASGPDVPPAGAGHPPSGEPRAREQVEEPGAASPEPGMAAPAGPPLRLQLQLVPGRARNGGAARPSVRIVASAPVHLAAYQVDATGRVTPLLPASGAARMPASTSLQLATRPHAGGARVVALAARQPLSARAFYRCLLAALAAPPAADADAPLTVGNALTAVSAYLARQVGAGAASEPLPERGGWEVGVSGVLRTKEGER